MLPSSPSFSPAPTTPAPVPIHRCANPIHVVAFYVDRMRRRKCRRSAEKVVRLMRPLIHSLAKNFAAYGYEYEEMVGCGYLGLCKAIRDYDPARRTAFPAVARVYVHNEMVAFLRHNPVDARYNRGNAIALETFGTSGDHRKRAFGNHSGGVDSDNDIEGIAPVQRDYDTGLLVWEYLQGVEEDKREAFLLVHVCGYTLREVAPLFSVQPATIMRWSDAVKAGLGDHLAGAAFRPKAILGRNNGTAYVPVQPPVVIG